MPEVDAAEFERRLETMDAGELIYLRWKRIWTAKARLKQIPPEDKPWDIYGLRAGRGFGKTEAGSNWIGLEAAADAKSYNHVIAPTFDDVKETCFEGPTGLVNCIPQELVASRDKGLPSITLWNGAFIRGFSADSPERLRGPQCGRGWLDEIASWRNPQKVWDNYRFGLRLGKSTKTVWTSTLKPTPFVRKLLKMPRSLIVQGSTYENRANLAPNFFESITQYEGTEIGKQELYGDLLDASDSGFIKRKQWQLWPASKPLPRFHFVVMSLDTAFTEATFDKKEQTGDPTGCSVWGVFEHEGKANAMLLDCWEDWLGLPKLMAKIKRERKNAYGAADLALLDVGKPLYGMPLYGATKGTGREVDIILIEDKGSGISLRQVLSAEDIITEPYNPGKADKLSRLHTVSPMFASNRVWAVESSMRPGEFRDWAEPLILQVCTYVGAGSLEHDDLLDSATQALKYIADRFMGAFTKPPRTKQQLLDDAIAARPAPMINHYG